jgi:hypothetical protein
MTVGFKTGPRNFAVGKTLVEEDGFDMCEVWFRVDRLEDYTELFNWLTSRSVRIGLHHWGMCRGGITPNISTADKAIRRESIAQIKQAIAIGAGLGCVYVNVHPGSEQLVAVTFDPWTFTPKAQRTKTAEAEKFTEEAMAELSAYAAERGVVLTLETLPRAGYFDERDRTRLFDPGFMSTETVARITARFGFMANDITHTATSYPRDNASREELWEFLLDFTRRCAAQTKLLHANTTVGPFLGADTHDGVRPEDFAAGVFPNRSQLLELLYLFKDRNDVFVVPEPKEHMRENAVALRELVAALNVS